MEKNPTVGNYFDKGERRNQLESSGAIVIISFHRLCCHHFIKTHCSRCFKPNNGDDIDDEATDDDRYVCCCNSSGSF